MPCVRGAGWRCSRPALPVCPAPRRSPRSSPPSILMRTIPRVRSGAMASSSTWNTASNIKNWDGRRTAIYWHKDGCGANSLIPFNGHLLVACYDEQFSRRARWRAASRFARSVRTAAASPSSAPTTFAADGHGGIYFSASGVYDIKAPISGAVLHITADGKTITEVANTIHYSNGLTLARDQQHLLVAEMLAGRVLSFLIGPDGRLGAAHGVGAPRGSGAADAPRGRLQRSGRPQARSRW